MTQKDYDKAMLLKSKINKYKELIQFTTDHKDFFFFFDALGTEKERKIIITDLMLIEKIRQVIYEEVVSLQNEFEKL